MEHLTTQQVGKILNVTPQRVLALIRAGRLPATKVGRDWLITRQDLATFEKRPQGNYKLTAEQVPGDPIHGKGWQDTCGTGRKVQGLGPDHLSAYEKVNLDLRALLLFFIFNL